MRLFILAMVALACAWTAQVAVAEKSPDTARSADEMPAAMRQVRIADDAESLIRSALDGAAGGYVLQRVDKHASPFDLEKGDGTAYFIGLPLKDMDLSKVKQSYSLVLWVMPADYQGRKLPMERPSPMPTPWLALAAANGNVYVWPSWSDEALALLNVVAPLPEVVVKERNRLLAEADAKIRKGLASLADRYPQLRQPPTAKQVFESTSRAGEVAILLHNSQHKSKVGPPSAAAPEDEFGVTIFLLQPSLRRSQLATWALLSNLRMAGQIGLSANNKDLEAELKALVEDALKPLRDLDARLAPKQPDEAKEN